MADVKRIRKLWLNHHVINSEKNKEHSENKSARIKHVLNDALYREHEGGEARKVWIKIEIIGTRVIPVQDSRGFPVKTQ